MSRSTTLESRSPLNRVGIGRLLGEFLVIVMGVLVALGVDEWRGSLRARADESLHIERLIRDLVSDSVNLAQIIDAGRRKAADIDDALENLADSALIRRSPSAGWPSLSYTYQRPPLQTTTFDQLEATGALSLIRDDDLRFHIGDHYRRALHHFSRLDDRRTMLAGAVVDVFPLLPGERNIPSHDYSDPTRAALRDSVFFASPHAEERMALLLGSDFRGRVGEERLYALDMEVISLMMLDGTVELLASLRAYSAGGFR